MLILGAILMTIGACLAIYVFVAGAVATIYWVAGGLFLVGLALTIYSLRARRSVT